MTRLILSKVTIFYLLGVVMCLFLMMSFSYSMNLRAEVDMEANIGSNTDSSIGSNAFDKLIMTPPIMEDNENSAEINNGQDTYMGGQKEEIVYVPTPVDPTYFQQMMQSPDTKKTENFMNLQKEDYEKYFKAINNLEYQKVYQSLNREQDQKIQEDIANSEAGMDYNSLVNKYSLNRLDLLQNNTFPVNTNSSLVIDLPQNKKEVEDVYSNFFTNVNLNNSMSFIQKSKDIDVINGKVPIYGDTNAKVSTFVPAGPIGVPSPNDLSTIKHGDYRPRNQNLTTEDKIEGTKIEMQKRERENFPRFRSELPYEKRDKEEEKMREVQKRKNFEDITKKIDSSAAVSLVQQQSSGKEKLMKAVDIIISKRNKSVKDTIRNNLANCKRSCDQTCNRVANLKKETEEICQLKCYMACSNNALNKLLG